MSHPHFVTEEKLGGNWGALALNKRLFLSLPLFLKCLPLSLFLIASSSIFPSFFRWYAGSWVSETVIGNQINIRTIPYLNFMIPLSAYGLAFIGVLSAMLRIGAWISFEITGIWAAQRIHGQMVQGLSGTRTTYFDENPSGRLINRLVRDYDEVRSTAIIFVGDVLNASIEIVSVAVLAWMANPWAMVLIFPLLFSLFYFQKERASLVGHARNLSAVAVSKVYDRKGDLVEGRDLFLLYSKSEQLIKRMQEAYVSYARASALTFLVETWASFWIRLSADLYAFGVLVFLSFLLDRKSVV